MCYDNKTVFLTDDLFKIERYADAKSAIAYFKDIERSKPRFLLELDDSELKDVWLQVGILTISTKMNCRI